MITKEEFELRKRQLEWFNRWEATEVLPERPAERVLDDLGTILEWIPPEVRAEERDPERKGIRRMHELLRLLSSK